jgi:hypothetical protein
VEYLTLGGPIQPPPISQACNSKESIFGFLDNIYKFTYITTIEIGWKPSGEYKEGRNCQSATLKLFVVTNVKTLNSTLQLNIDGNLHNA